MDLASDCKDKLAYFRIKELKDVLTQLGLSKQGKKQDLVDRILNILSDEQAASSTWTKKHSVSKEEVAKLVDDTYRKMQGSGAVDLASKGQCISDSSTPKLKEEIEDLYQMDKTRCPCGNSLKTDSMIKCEDRRCNVWQHISCVIIPEKPLEGVLPVPPEVFYCELCRLTRADPFWVTVAHPLQPVKWTITNISTDGKNPVQSVERTFQLTRADKDLLVKQEYDVQAWCILLNDKVPFRMHWPQFADLQVNGVPVRAINRPGSQLLGANGRDDGPVITPCTRDGINKISLTGCDARVFCLGVRIVKRRNVQHILALIPKEGDGEKFEDALARVRRCVGGGTPTENADSDSDLEVVSDSIPVNLRCPMSGSRMKVAGRFKPCAHMGCFDLEVFVEMNQRSRKWQCPVCLKNYSLENIVIDPYFNRITSKMRNCEEDVTEIEVKPDGSWRAKPEKDHRGLGDLGQWHLPDSTLCVANNNSKPEIPKQVKQELGSEGHNTGLKLGIRKNRNGRWELKKPVERNTNSLSSKQEEKFKTCHHNVIPMSSSTTGSGGNGDDRSVNQGGSGGGGGNYDFSTNNVELDSFALNLDCSTYMSNHDQNQNPSAALVDDNVIVLSDSEEENENQTLISSVQVYSAPSHGIPDSFPQDSGLGLFNNDDDFGVPLWPLPPSNQGNPGFQFFGSDGSDHLVNGSMNGYNLTDETAILGSSTTGLDHSLNRSSDLNDGLLGNPLGFGGEDPSLQLFLPTRPPLNAELRADLSRQSDVSNSARNEDWISLRLGGGGGHGEHANANGTSFRQQLPAKDGALDTLATASMIIGMSENNNINNNNRSSSKASRERSDSPFSFPRQRRSVRPRLYLSIDSDSE